MTVQADNGIGEPVRVSWTVFRFTPELEGLWCLEEGEGLVAEDAAGGREADLANMDEDAWVDGEVSEFALQFDGFDDFLLIAPEGEEPLDFRRSYTWADWVNTSMRPDL